MAKSIVRHTEGLVKQTAVRRSSLQAVRRSSLQAVVAESQKAGLTGQQLAALEGLRLGQAPGEVAEGAGVSRATVYRWVKNDAAFRAAYNQWQEEMEEHCRARLMRMSAAAADAIEFALERGDARVAMQLLKHMAVMRPSGPRLTDEEDVRRRMETDRKVKSLEMELEAVRLEDKVAIHKAGRQEMTNLLGKLDEPPPPGTQRWTTKETVPGKAGVVLREVTLQPGNGSVGVDGKMRLRERS